MSFLGITVQFSKDIKNKSLEIGKLVYSRKTGIKEYLDSLLGGLIPFYDDLFKDGRKTGVEQIQNDFAKLSNRFDVPIKYNKDVLENINGESIFTGYFDRNYQDLFTRREIYNLKSTILKAKYTGATEEELTQMILNTVDTTKKRAQLLARQETSRLRHAAVDEYWKLPKVKKKYDKKWQTAGDDRVRQTHKSYNGKIADEEGYFYGDLGAFKYPPIEFNCRCRVILVSK